MLLMHYEVDALLECILARRGLEPICITRSLMSLSAKKAVTLVGSGSWKKTRNMSGPTSPVICITCTQVWQRHVADAHKYRMLSTLTSNPLTHCNSSRHSSRYMKLRFGFRWARRACGKLRLSGRWLFKTLPCLVYWRWLEQPSPGAVFYDWRWEDYRGVLHPFWMRLQQRRRS